MYPSNLFFKYYYLKSLKFIYHLTINLFFCTFFLKKFNMCIYFIIILLIFSDS